MKAKWSKTTYKEVNKYLYDITEEKKQLKENVPTKERIGAGVFTLLRICTIPLVVYMFIAYSPVVIKELCTEFEIFAEVINFKSATLALLILSILIVAVLVSCLVCITILLKTWDMLFHKIFPAYKQRTSLLAQYDEYEKKISAFRLPFSIQKELQRLSPEELAYTDCYIDGNKLEFHIKEKSFIQKRVVEVSKDEIKHIISDEGLDFTYLDGLWKAATKERP